MSGSRRKGAGAGAGRKPRRGAKRTAPDGPGPATHHAELPYRVLFQAAAEGILVADAASQHFLYANPAICRMFGYSESEFVALGVHDIHPAAALPEVLAEFAAQVAGRKVLAAALPCRRQDGTVFWADIVAAPAVIGGRQCSIGFFTDVTERQGAATAVQRSEVELRGVLDSTADGLLVVGRDGRVILRNARFGRMWRIPAALLTAGDDAALLAFVLDQLASPEAFLAKVRALYASDAEDMDELRFKDGRVFERYSRPLTLEGEVVGRVWSFRDVTERQQAEAALRRSEQKYRSLIETTDTGVVILDADGLVVDANATYARLAGRPALADILGRRVDEWTAPHERERNLAAVRQCLAQGFIRNFEIDYVTPDGRVTPVEINATVVREAAGSHILSLVRDIGERQRAATALREKERFLSESQRIAHIGSWSASLDGAIQWTDETYRIYGVAPETFTPTIASLLSLVHPEDRPALQRWIAAGAAGQAAADLEFRALRPDGAVRLLAGRGELVFDAAHRPAYIAGTVQDITERKGAEAERLAMERRLLHTQKLESLGVLAGGIAHDFNNLLMAILGNLDVALLDLPPGAPARAGVEPAIQATQRAADLTRQLLAYSGRGRFVVARLDLSDLVRENAGLFRAAVARTVTFRLDLAAGPCGVAADPGQVQQVIMNLITNASEAIGTRPGVIALATGVLTADAEALSRSRLPTKPAPGQFAWVEVTDTGCGMDAATQQHLFEPFFTTKFTGRGLGMSAVLGIVQGHRGAILVDSEVGRGTTVRVLFPACDLAPVAPAPAAPALDAAGRSRLILVVDDEAIVRTLTLAYVGRLGFRGLAAVNGHEALALFAQYADEVVAVLLDLTMPQLDGLSTFRELRRRRADLPVILCSGYSESDALRQFADEGLAGFLQKPYRLRDLEAALQRALAPDAGLGQA